MKGFRITCTIIIITVIINIVIIAIIIIIIIICTIFIMEDGSQWINLGELSPWTEDVGAGVKWEKKPNSANLKTLMIYVDDDSDDDGYHVDDDGEDLQDHVHLPEARKAFIPDWSQQLLDIWVCHKLDKDIWI